MRIRLRRRIADCVVLANKLEVLLDDLLWILSDRQIQAALLCVKSLSDAIEASRRQMMKLQRSNSDMSLASSDTASSTTSPENHLQESSQHFSINKLDLHICEGFSLFTIFFSQILQNPLMLPRYNCPSTISPWIFTPAEKQQNRGKNSFPTLRQ